MKKILIPVDFSDYSEIAMQYGLRMASVIGAEIRLFHAFLDPVIDAPIPMYDFGGYEKVHQELLTEAETHEKERLENYQEILRRQIAQNHIQNVELGDYIYQKGFPAEEIVAAANHYQSDVIILGGKRKTGIMKGIFSGVTEDVINQTDIPVMVIPQNRIAAPEGHIMYATNYDEADFKNILRLIELLAGFQTKLYFVHICFGTMDREDKVNMVKIRRFVQKEYPSQLVVYDIVESENLIEGFDKYMSANQIDMIALTSHKRNFLTRLFSPNLTKTLLTQTKIPMLIFH